MLTECYYSLTCYLVLQKTTFAQAQGPSYLVSTVRDKFAFLHKAFWSQINFDRNISLSLAGRMNEHSQAELTALASLQSLSTKAPTWDWPHWAQPYPSAYHWCLHSAGKGLRQRAAKASRKVLKPLLSHWSYTIRPVKATVLDWAYLKICFCQYCLYEVCSLQFAIAEITAATISCGEVWSPQILHSTILLMANAQSCVWSARNARPCMLIPDKAMNGMSNLPGHESLSPLCLLLRTVGQIQFQIPRLCNKSHWFGSECTFQIQMKSSRSMTRMTVPHCPHVSMLEGGLALQSIPADNLQ